LGIVMAYNAQLKTPFHEFCLKSGVLCRACQKKVDGGDFSNFDLEVGKVLISLEIGGRPAEEGEFIKSYSGRGILLVKLRKGSMSSIAPIVNKVREEIGASTKRKAILFEEGEQLRAVAERLLYPAKITSVRTSWLPGGTNMTTLKVTGKTDVDIKEAARLVSQLFGVEINITGSAPSQRT